MKRKERKKREREGKYILTSRNEIKEKRKEKKKKNSKNNHKAPHFNLLKPNTQNPTIQLPKTTPPPFISPPFPKTQRLKDCMKTHIKHITEPAPTASPPQKTALPPRPQFKLTIPISPSPPPSSFINKIISFNKQLRLTRPHSFRPSQIIEPHFYRPKKKLPSPSRLSPPLSPSRSYPSTTGDD